MVGHVFKKPLNGIVINVFNGFMAFVFKIQMKEKATKRKKVVKNC